MDSITDRPFKPTRQQLLDAVHKTLPDLLAPDLTILFCGINPGLYTAAIGHSFGRPGNRFWPALFAGGLTPRLYSPFEDRALLELGFGLTNLVSRATARADELTADEIRAGALRLRRKLARYRPRICAIVGIGAYRVAFNRPRATLGLQEEMIHDTRLFILPNTSGLNAHYQPADLARRFAELRALASSSAMKRRKVIE